jgi:hypothetical protein
MRPLSTENIESELSYAYLHAVSAHAGIGCEIAGRHDDSAGVDAKLTGWAPFSGNGWRTEIDIKVQLKATVRPPSVIRNCFSYYFQGIERYNDLRMTTLSTPRILVVLFLPSDRNEWLSHTDDALSLRKCAYWVSLRGAPATANVGGQTVYLPRSQRFDSDGLAKLMSRLSSDDIPYYRGAEA